MITATCNNTDCKVRNISFRMFGQPDSVQCGACRNDCELSDPQPDPPEPQSIQE